MKRKSGWLSRLARRILLIRTDPLRWLVVVGFPLMITLGGLIVLGLVQHNNVMRGMMAERDTRTARVIASMISEEFEECEPQIANPLDCLHEIDITKLALPSSEKKMVTAFLVNSSGVALMHTNPAGINASAASYPGVQEALRGNSGFISTLYGPDSIDRLIAYAPVDTRGRFGMYAFILDEPWDEGLDLFTRFSLALPFIAVGVMAVSGLIFALVMRAQTQHAQLRLYARALTNAEEAERNRLARDLHDGTVQDLVALHQKTQLLRMDAAKEAPSMLGLIEEVRDDAHNLINDVRRTSHDLRPIHLDELGLVAALEKIANEMNAAGRAQEKPCIFTFTNNLKNRRLRKELEMAFYRIAQEAITNAIRHANPSLVNISLTIESGLAHLLVEDNGSGFDLEIAKSGLGLISMYERASFVDGMTEVQTAPGQGTQVHVYAPL